MTRSPGSLASRAPSRPGALILGALVTVGALAATGCHRPPADDGVCRCTPDNRSPLKLGDGTALDGAAVLAELRRRQQKIAQHRPARDIKLLDDELRLQLTSFCQPCGDWIGDRLTVEDMFPLDRLDRATTAVCLGLVLGDGATAYGNARPPACR